MIKLKVAQVGFGKWGPNLSKVLAQSPYFDFRYLADNTSAGRATAKESYPDISVSSDWKTLLDYEIDAVIIATPAMTHFEIAKTFLEHGKHVFVEKPLATSLNESRQLAKIAKQNNCTLMVGHVFLYHDAVHYIRNNLHKLGDLFHITSYRHNFGRIRSDVNCWWNLAPHDLSVLLFLMNNKMPSSISVVGHSFIQKGIEDFAEATLEWENGVVAHISVNWYTPHKTRKMLFAGSNAMLTFDDVQLEKIEIHHKNASIEKLKDSAIPHIHHQHGQIEIPEIEYSEPLLSEMKHFYDCITQGTPCISGPQHACNVIELLEVGNKSIKEGGRKIELASEKY